MTDDGYYLVLKGLNGDAMVNVTDLKKFAKEKLPLRSKLRYLVLEEPDQIPLSEYKIKAEIWAKLSEELKEV